jgi:hypothetical protein
VGALVCGQWLAPEAAGWSPPPALGEFLAAGEPPIYVGFGSMAGFERRSLLREIVAAVAGRRALFYPGWSGVTGADLPANFLVIGDTPHAWLFPRMSLVIHHGGAGTTHSAARAGAPSVVAPFAGDQLFWADRLRRAGVAPPRAGEGPAGARARPGHRLGAGRLDPRPRRRARRRDACGGWARGDRRRHHRDAASSVSLRLLTQSSRYPVAGSGARWNSRSESSPTMSSAVVCTTHPSTTCPPMH